MKKSIFRSILIPCAALIILTASIASAQETKIYVVDDAVKISPEGKIFSTADLENYASSNPVWNGKQISLAGARGEYVAFQVQAAAGSEGLRAVDVKISELRNPAGNIIPAVNFQRYCEWYVTVIRPSTSPRGSAGLGDYPDALVPADAPKHGLPIDIAPGKTQGIWIDLHIPRDAAAGNYTATVNVISRGNELAEIPLTLHVYNFAIPAERHLRWRIGYSGFEEIAADDHISTTSDQYLKLEQDLYNMCWEECRFVPTTHYNTPQVPSHGSGKNFAFDWTFYDKRFGKYLDGSAFADHQPINIFSLPINCMAKFPTGGLDINNLDVETLDAACRDMVKHWKAKNWDLNSGFVYVADEPDPAGYAAIEQECRTIHNVDPHIATSVAFYTHFGDHAAQLVDQFKGLVSMWDIAGDYMNLPALLDRQKAGDAIGFYQGSEPFQGSEALDSDALGLTTWPWIAWKYNLDHLFLYNMCEWTYFRLNRGDGRKKPWANLPRQIWENPLNQSWQTNSQGVLIYPGKYVGVAGFVPSVRMMEIRRGMQDYEYFWLLSQKGKKALADRIVTDIIHKALYEASDKGLGDAAYGPGAWERDPRKWADARKQIAEAILRN